MGRSIDKCVVNLVIRELAKGAFVGSLSASWARARVMFNGGSGRSGQRKVLGSRGSGGGMPLCSPSRHQRGKTLLCLN